MGLGGRQDEPNAWRRLLEDLQQRVEGLPREPLGLVDDVDLLPPHGRRGGGPFPQLSRVVDASVRGRVDLHHVQVRAVADADALLAHPAWFGRRAAFAVHHPGQDPGGRGLSGSPRPAEKEGVRQAPFTDGSHQRADDVLLPDDLVGRLRPVLPIEGDFLSHAVPSPSRG